MLPPFISDAKDKHPTFIIENNKVRICILKLDVNNSISSINYAFFFFFANDGLAGHCVMKSSLPKKCPVTK